MGSLLNILKGDINVNLVDTHTTNKTFIKVDTINNIQTFKRVDINIQTFKRVDINIKTFKKVDTNINILDRNSILCTIEDPDPSPDLGLRRKEFQSSVKCAYLVPQVILVT